MNHMPNTIKPAKPVPFLRWKTPVHDLQTNTVLEVWTVCHYQPFLADGIYRARLHPDDRMMLCQYNRPLERWEVLGEAPSPIDGSLHPDLYLDDQNYILAAREVLRQISPTAGLKIALDCARIGEFQQKLKATVVYEDPEDRIFMDDNSIDLIPGARFVDRQATLLGGYFNVKCYDDGSGTEGDFECHITQTSLNLSYKDGEEVLLTLTSRLEDGEWIHETKMTIPDYEQLNIVETMKRENRTATDRFVEMLPDESSFVETFSLKRPDLEILSCRTLDEGPTEFTFKPGSLRSC